MLVKLESNVGVVWMNPTHVVSLMDAGGGDTRLERSDGATMYVTGTPDEVRTRLFPETDDARPFGAPLSPTWPDPAMTGLNSVARGGANPTTAETGGVADDHALHVALNAAWKGQLSGEVNSKAARDVCAAACAVLVRTLPPEERTALDYALEASSGWLTCDDDDAAKDPENTARVIRHLAFAVRRLSGREG